MEATETQIFEVPNRSPIEFRSFWDDTTNDFRGPIVRLNKNSKKTNSELSEIEKLEENWDGSGAEKPTAFTITRAKQILALSGLDESLRPNLIYPGPSDFIVLVWKNPNVQSRLEIWIYGGYKFKAEWCIENSPKDSSGTASTISEIKEIIRSFCKSP